jgi:histidyl-tRNA synthetase
LEFTAIKGFKDILPEEVANWQRVESEARRIFPCFGFEEIRTPVLEKTELFRRSIGEDTDIVSKEMYTLYDSKGGGLTLRPEATASVTRAFIQHKRYQSNGVEKFFTIGPMFRHERPQRGRFRQFHQINAELFGDPGPRSDAEILVMAMSLFDSLGMESLTLHLNSLGCRQCRPQYKDRLKNYLDRKTQGLCPDCQKRCQFNPLRVFDCKVDGCKKVMSEAPSILEFNCQSCQDHLMMLQGFLSRERLPFVLNSRLVRGLDYYTRTAFEIQTDQLGAQNAVAGGGRYDGLVKQLGGPDLPAIGFAVGVERVVALLEMKGVSLPKPPILFIAALGNEAERICFQYACALRKAGLRVEMDYGLRGLKGQMKRADRLGAEKVLIVGEDEIRSGKGILRDMGSKIQTEIDLVNVVDNLAKRM